MTDTPLEPGTRIHQRYQIDRILFQDEWRTLCEAVDQESDQRVLLKCLPAATEITPAVFKQHVRALSRLEHTRLPTLRDSLQEQGYWCLVLDYTPGVVLADDLPDGQSYSIETACRWLDQLLDGLAYLHEQQPPFIHGGLKPWRLLRLPGNDIMLLDPGGLTVLHPSEQSTSNAYTPPEQQRGDPLTPASDLYALAAVAYRWLTGVVPPGADERYALIAAGQDDPLQPPHAHNAQIPVALSTVLLRMLALNLAERPTSAAALRADLRAALTTSSGSTAEVYAIAPDPASQPGDDEIERARRLLFPSLIALLAMLVVVVIFVSTNLSTISPPDLAQATPARTSTPGPEQATLQALEAAAQATIAARPTVRPSPEPSFTPRPTITTIPTSSPIPSATPAPPSLTGFAAATLTFGSEGSEAGKFEDARYIASDPAGNVFVGDFQSGRIQKFDSQGTYLLEWMAQGEDAVLDMTADVLGNIYVVRDGDIWQYSGETGNLLNTFSLAQAAYKGVAPLPGGGIVASVTIVSQGFFRDDLVFLDAQGQIFNRLIDIGPSVNGESETVREAAVDTVGRIFVLGLTSPVVYRLAPTGEVELQFGPGEEAIVTGSIAIDNQNRVYLAALTDTSYIQVFDAEGNMLGSIGREHGLNGLPQDLALDAEGNLWTITSDQQVIRLTPNDPLEADPPAATPATTTPAP